MKKMKLPNVNFTNSSVFKFLEDRGFRGTSPCVDSGGGSASGDEGNGLILIMNGKNDLKKPKNNTEMLKRISKIVTKGSAIVHGVTMTPNDFQVSVRDLDVGNLSLDFQGPSYIRLDYQIMRNGLLGVSYRVSISGVYVFVIKYNGFDIPGSPFNVNIKDHPNRPAPIPRNCKAVVARGKGLRVSKLGEIATFQIDTRKAGDGRLAVFLDCAETADSKTNCDIQYIPNKDGWKVKYICPIKGYYFLRVKFDGKHIPGSPFRAECCDAEDQTDIQNIFLSTFRIKRKDSKGDDIKRKGLTFM